MKYGIYSVRDEASAIFMGVTLSLSNDQAIRDFDYALSTNDLMKFKPEDFALYYLGEYDNIAGTLEAHDTMIIKRGVKRNGKK